MPERKCPVDPFWKCPLHAESHVGSGLGCVKDMAEPCLVVQGKMSFDKQLAEIVKRNAAIDKGSLPRDKWSATLLINATPAGRS